VTHPFFSGLKAPLHSAHRGGAALYPENTLHAFRAAVTEHQTDLLELDLQASKDGALVVAHDDTLDRCTDGRGPLKALTYDELSQLDAAYKFTTDVGVSFPLRGRGIGLPRFAEVLEAFPTVKLNVELKTFDAVEPFVAMVKSQPSLLERLCIGSEHDAVAAKLVEALPDGCFFYPRDALVAFVLGFKGGELVDDPRYTVLDMPLKYQGLTLFDRALADEATRLGKWVNVWTVDDEAEMRKAIADGVGGIMTDRPDVLRAVLGPKA
jgi:glycerophosphoryl diester phosphodiesterase